ncbi:hypothetical protein P692DRAFT_20205982 [Suillus brevipes Sb2]|nr:hypothetical protein P692DRAFT_20205982 [Suillus brevipes Sb2]
MGSTITSVSPHGTMTSDLLHPMIGGPEKAGLSSGVHCTIRSGCHHSGISKGKSEQLLCLRVGEVGARLVVILPLAYAVIYVHQLLLKVGHSKVYGAAHSPQSGISAPTLRVSDVVADTVRAMSRCSNFGI